MPSVIEDLRKGESFTDIPIVPAPAEPQAITPEVEAQLAESRKQMREALAKKGIPAPPLAPGEKAQPADPFAGEQQADAFAGEEEVSDAFKGERQADALDERDPKDLARDPNFKIHEFIFANKDNVFSDPRRYQKALDTYREAQAEGVTLKKTYESAKKDTLPLLKDILKSVPKRLENISDIAIAPLVDSVTMKLRGEGTDPEKRDQWENMTEDGKEAAIAEAIAGSQTAVGSLQDMVRQGTRKLVGPAFELGGKKDWRKITDDELKNELFKDLGWRETVEGLASGEGVKDLVSEGVELNPENIKLLSLTDPITLVATGGGLKAVGLGGKVLFTAANQSGATAALNYLGRQAGQAAAKGAQLVGRGAEVTGQLVQKAAHLPTFTAAGLGSGHYIKAVSTGLAVKGAGKIIEVGGRVAKEVGEAAGAAPKGQLSLGLQTTTGAKVLDAAKSAAAFVKPPVAGAAKGAAATAPLALSTDEPQGGLLGVGAVGGAIHGGVAGVKGAVAERAAKRYFDPGQITWEKTQSPAYDGFTELNTVHEQVASHTPENSRNMVDSLRETLRPFGKKLFLVDDATFAKAIENDTVRANSGQALTPEQAAAVAAEAQSRGISKIFMADDAGVGEMVTLVKSSADAPHEFSHVLESVMAPEAREALHDAVRKAYKPEELDALQAHYEQQLGRAVTPDEARSEFIADNWANLLYNTPLETLGLPPAKSGFRQKFLDAAVQLGEALGIDMTAGRATPGLDLRPSYSLRKALENATGEILSERNQRQAQAKTAVELPVEPAVTAEPPKPVEVPVEPVTAQGELPLFEQPSAQPEPAPAATPPAPVPVEGQPTARSIRTTQKDLSARRAETTNAGVAQKWAEGKPNQPAVQEVNRAMDENVGLQVEHSGAKAEKFNATEPERAVEIEEGRGLPPEARELHGKELRPTRWETTKSGMPQLIARSTDKVLANVDRTVQWAKATGEPVPWATDANGALTPDGLNDLMADLNSYWDNQDRGFRGGGEPLVRPPAELGASIPAERGEGILLGAEKEQWLNLLQGKDVGPPATARTVKGQLPANIKAQEIRAAQGLESERIAPGTEIPVYPETATKGRGPVELRETNPLRNRFRAAGMPVQNLHTVVERLNAPDIVTARRAPSITGRGGSTDIARAGFLTDQPVAKTIEDVHKTTPEEWQQFFGPSGSLTRTAYELGLGLKSKDDVAALLSAQETASKAAQESMAKVKAGNFDALDEASANATKAQFFREAIEAATDSGSAAGPSGWRKAYPERTAPFAAEARKGMLTEEPLTPESEFRKEADFAKEVIAGAKQISDYPFYDSYKTTLADEAKLVDKGSVVFVGSGPMPISQILLEENLGRRVDGLDIAPEAVSVGNKVLNKAGVKGRMFSGAGEEARLGDYDNVVVALDAGTTPEAKGQILSNVHAQVKPDATVLVRSSMDESFPQVGDSYKGLFTVEDRVPTFDGLSETLKLKKVAEETRGGYLPKKRKAAGRETEEQAMARVAATDYSKYNVPEEAKPKSGKPTGWILPDGEFVGLDTDFHEQWLGENSSRLNDQFGTAFGSEATVMDRVDALNKGFVRARDYAGRMVVEVNKDFYRGAQKRAIEKLLDDNAENVDNVRLTLLDSKGNVTDQATAKLFDADDPRIELEKMLDSVNPRAGAPKAGPSAIQRARALGGDEREGYLAKEKLTPKTAEAAAKSHNEEMDKAYPEAYPTRFVRDSKDKLKLTGGKLTPADEEAVLDQTPLARDAVRNNPGVPKQEAIAQALSDKIVDEANTALKNPEMNKGLTWYDDAVKLIKKYFGADPGLFAQLLAATSPQNGVQVNFYYALDAWNAARRGEYDGLVKKYKEGRAEWKTGGPEVSEWVEETGGTHKPDATVVGQKNRNNFLTWFVDKHDLLPKRKSSATGEPAKYGMHSFAVLDVLAGTWLEDVGGPKVKNFLSNLTGEGHDATIDIWATRFLMRLGQSPESLQGQWRVAPPAGWGISAENFTTAQKAFQMAADKMGVKPDALQALVWFSEKQRWEDNGWTGFVGAAKSDYAYWLQSLEPGAHPETLDIPVSAKKEASRQGRDARQRTEQRKSGQLDIPLVPSED